MVGGEGQFVLLFFFFFLLFFEGEGGGRGRVTGGLAGIPPLYGAARFVDSQVMHSMVQHTSRWTLGLID